MTVMPSPLPIVAAPMAGGGSTPELVAAVGEAGGLGFVAAGYLAPEALEEQLVALERRTDRPYGLNLFLGSPSTADPEAVSAYAARIAPEAAAVGAALGEPRWDDDALAGKLDVLAGHRPAVVSFTFGAPDAALGDRVRAATGALVAATVTSADEATVAVEAGADLLCVQGAEAGGHRGIFRDRVAHPAGGEATPLVELLDRVGAVTDVPLIAAGGLMGGADIAGALRHGAVAAQLGTAFLCCPEAGTSASHRRALLDAPFAETAFTRAFTGRPARALVNGFVTRHGAAAPTGYPELHHLTRPMRAAAAREGDLDRVHLWAGTGWRGVTEEPAGALVGRLARELDEARAS